MKYGSQLRLLSCLLAASVVSGCEPRLPTEALRPVTTAPTKLLSSQNSATSWTIVDEYDGDEWDGKSFTFDAQARRVTVSDGRVWDLTEEQSDLVVGMFAGTVAVDPSTEDVGGLTQGDVSPPSCNDPSCWMTDKVGVAGPINVPILARRKGETGKGRPISARALSTGLFGATLGHGFRLREVKGPTVLANGYFDMCSDIVNQAIPRTLDFKTRRTSFLKDIMPNVVQQMVDGVLKSILPGSSSFAGQLQQISVDHYHARIQVNWLGMLWNSYDCGSKKVRAGPVTISNTIGGGGSGSGADKRFVCKDENWQISFDGGETWYPITVSVCEWELMT